MSLKAKIEAIIYATEEPVTLNELASLLKDAALADMRAAEEARLALNEIVSDGEAAAEIDEDDVVAEAALADEISAPVEASQSSPESTVLSDDAPTASKELKTAEDREQLRAVKGHLSHLIEELIADYASPDRGMEIRQVASGYRMATKPEHHDVVVSFAKSLKPPVRLSLQALETLAVIAYKQPITVPEISEIRGVDSAGVIATLLDRKLVTTGGRKQVIGRPILYKTTKEFLMRFGLKDIGELPSMEEFEKLGDPQSELFEPKEASEPEPVTEALPAADSEGTLMGKTNIPASGVYESEAEAVMSETPVGELSPDHPVGQPGDTTEPVTEAVPEHSDAVLKGETNESPGGSFESEAQSGERQES